jgi:transcriptional regulator with XRE-family HTH domain
MGHPRPDHHRRIPLDARRAPYFSEWGEVVGGRIRRLRRERGFTLNELARQPLTPEGAGHSPGYLSQLERGWSSPPLYTYVALAHALDETPGRLFGPDVTEVDPAESTLLECLRRVGIAPHEALVRLLGPRHADQQLSPVDHDGIAAVE